MEGLKDFSALSEPEIPRRAVPDHDEATFISFSFLTDDNDLEELNTINETAIDDYSQASTALISNSSRESDK